MSADTVTDVMAETALLSVRGLSVSYGRTRAVNQLDLDIAPGETVALLGANGAGKSSTLLALSGVVPATGETVFDGVRIDDRPPHEIVRAGLIQVPEQRAIFPDLTVAENLEVGGYTRTAGPDLEADLAMVHEALPRLAQLRNQRAGSLSGGEQQMLVLAKALFGGPRLLLIDELSLGLAPIVVRDLYRILGQIRERGVSILLVEQFVPLALRLADRALVLQKGEVVFRGTASELRARRDILEASYLGERT